MFKSLFICILFCLLMVIEGLPQSSTQSAISTYTYHPPSTDKASWQRLNLMMSATYFRVVKEGEVDFDSCLVYASRSLGLSRLPVVAEGIDDPELLAQSQWVDRRDPAEGIRSLSQATGKKRLETLLLLGAYYAFEPRSNYHTDSVEYFLFKALDESHNLKEGGLRRQALCLLGKMYVQTNESKKGDSVFNQVISECGVAGDRQTEARAFEYRALYPEYHPATSQARITYFQKAVVIYHELNNTEGEINALTDAGYMLVTTFQLQPAYDAFLKALQLGESINFPYLHYNTDALAMVTHFNGKFGEPLKYTFQTIKTAETTRDSIGWAYFYSRLGSLYQSEGGREEESLKWSLKSLNHFLKAGDAGLFPNLYNVAGLLDELGRCNEVLDLLSTIYKKIPPQHPQDRIFYNLALSVGYRCSKQYKLAEGFVMEADRILQQSVTMRRAYQGALINSEFGLIYFKDGKFERSKKFLEQYLSDPSGARFLENEIVAYQYLITIDSKLGNTSSALNRYKQYTQLLDSNFRVSKIRQAEELQVMYETEEKQNQITLLNQEAELKQTNLNQATLIKNVTIGGIIAVLIIATLLYRQTRLRKKSNNVITHKNEQLQHLLTEKEWLVKEIHHRVKNNLQIVMSLLNSQSAYIDNEHALTAIHDSQHRVHAMSLIHQKLYGSANLSSIDMSIYVRELVSYLRDSFDTGQRIRFELNVEPLELDVSQAVPVGLILNEAITNSIKYAFPDDMEGVITISLSNTGLHNYLLTISDNGIGMPVHVKDKKPGSLGMSLMAGLSEDLDGNFSIENNRGTMIKISFVHDVKVKRTDISAVSFASNN